MNTCGAAIAHLLQQHGIRHVFGIPGNHTVELYRGLAATGIGHITTRHEQGAAFMADGYARATGQVGVCFLISGPGLLNAATAIAQADQDSIPMLVISSVSPAAPNSGALHQLRDQQQAASGFCSVSRQIDTPDQLPGAIADAFTFFATRRPGAYHLQIPTDVLAQPCTFAPPTTSASSTPAPDPGTLEQAASLLNQARAPLVLLGGGAIAASRLPQLLTRLDAPAVNTVNAKGIVPLSNPYAAGGSPSLPCLQQAIAQADVVLALGTQLAETDYDLLMTPLQPRQGQMISVNLDQPASADVWLQAPCEVVVNTLLPKLDQGHRNGVERTRQLRAAVRQEHHFHPDFAAFFDAIQAAFDDFVLVGDSTRPTYYAAWMYETPSPRRYFHSVSGFGTLGYAIPAAFGAAVGIDLPVVGLIGDGGAQFSIAELATAVDAGLGVPIIIWCNSGYEEITASMNAAGVESGSTRISGPDFVQLAQAYGCEAMAPQSPTELTAALQTALTFDRPSLILVDQSKFVNGPSGDWYG